MNKRTKALQITQKTKFKVWERQDRRSIISGTPISVSECCCHYIPRTKGGLGIEENIVGMTNEEHMIFDNNVIGGQKELSQQWREIARRHLKAHYPNWSEDKLIYRKE